MILTLKNIIKKYFKRNRKYISSNNILHRMNGAVLCQTHNNIFDMNGIMIDEVIKYCKEQGYNIDRIVLIYFYDINIHEGLNLKMDGDSEISIVEEDGEIIARVCIEKSVEIK